MRLLDGNLLVGQSHIGDGLRSTKGDIMPSDRRPAVRGSEAAWRRLGELLQLRRAELGYKRRPGFTRDRDINIRLVTDIENAYRPNTFLTPTLREIAQAYAVTYDSLAAVLAGTASTLEPAAPAAPVTRLPPMTGAARIASDRDYYKKINERRVDLAARGITDPSGTEMFLRTDGDPRDYRGIGSADDVKAWDGIGARLDIDDRVWFIADLQRRADGRDGQGGTESAPL
jgi:hypothetical protein